MLQLDIGIYEKLLSASLDGILAFDRDYQYIYWNSTMEKISGRKSFEVVGKNAFDVFPFLRETGEDLFYQMALDGQTGILESRVYVEQQSRQNRIFEGHYSPLRNEKGEIIGGIAIVRDVTEKKEVEQQISETESRFRMMADCAPVMLWMSRKDALCDFFNEGWLQFTGRSQEEEFGVGWAEGIHPEDFQRCMDTYLDAFNARVPFSMEYRFRRSDGAFRWILDNGVPRYLPDGTFTGYIGSCIDITDQKNIMDELDRTVNQLKQALRIRDDFLSIASHELITPMTPLKLQLHTLKRHLNGVIQDLPKSEVIANAFQVFDNQVIRLSKLIENLLDVSRIQGGRFEFNVEEADLVDVVQEVLQTFESQLIDAKCQLEVSMPPKIVGWWDRFRLEQVFSNLLSNAIKYGAGGPIQVSLSEHSGIAELSVKDRGVGIPRKDQIRIFHCFERAAPLEHFGGLGLGLYITQKIVLELGGVIQVESEPGQGALFGVKLPLNLAQKASSF